jgi:hypothetical protein
MPDQTLKTVRQQWAQNKNARRKGAKEKKHV